MPANADAPLSAENLVEAVITQLTVAADGAKPFVSLLVRCGGKQAKLQIESDPGSIEHAALPEVIRKEVAWLIDALEVISEAETPISVRLDPLGGAA